ATFYWLLTNASPNRARASLPSAPLRNGTFFIEAQPPLLGKRRGMLDSNSCHRFRNCSPRAITRNQMFMRTAITHFATCGTGLLTSQFSIFIRSLIPTVESPERPDETPSANLPAQPGASPFRKVRDRRPSLSGPDVPVSPA